MTGDFFAVGKKEWSKACDLGLNPAVAFLVLARGTGRDNSTTRWSAEAVSKTTGMSWRRAKAAIDAIEKAQIAINATEQGKLPMRKLAIASEGDAALWLPNALVTGAANEEPPLMRLRQAQNLDHLRAFIELYGMQDLAGDGGLPRTLVFARFKRRHICDAGQFKVYGFDLPNASYCVDVGPLTHFRKRNIGKQSASWVFLREMESMGLIETVDYLTEGESAESELIHALTGDAAADEVCVAAASIVASLPDGAKSEAREHDYVLPVIKHITAPAVMRVTRLTYRPHTALTAAWYARHRESCARFAEAYAALASRDYARAVAA